MSAWTGRTFPGARLLRAPLALCVLIVAGVPGCMHWARSDTTTAQLVETKHPDQVRITRVDGRTTVLTAPRIAGDSIVGTAMAPDGVRIPDYAIPLADVRDVAVRRLNVGATLGLAAGAGVTAALIAAAASRPSSPPPIVGGGGGGCGDGCYSCPLVYSWDGAHWRLDSGTFGGAIVRALERTDVDNLDYATARNGVVRLDVRNELNETDFVDQMAVVAVDHDSGVDVAPDPQGHLHAIAHLLEPSRATDLAGADVLPRIRRTDGWRWESVPRHRDPADTTDLRDGIVLVFPRYSRSATARLVVDANSTPWAAYLLGEFVRAHGTGVAAWYDSLDASPDQARALGLTLAREAFLRAELWTRGGWKPIGLFWEAGPEVVKRQVLAFDASAAAGDSIRLRLESAPSFWLIDRVALDLGPEPAIDERDLALVSARDRRGRDVRPALGAIDRNVLTLETGDGAELRFQDVPLSPGKTRSYILHATGWYRIHTPPGDSGNSALLAQVAADPRGVSRASAQAMNDALAALASGSR